MTANAGMTKSTHKSQGSLVFDQEHKFQPRNSEAVTRPRAQLPLQFERHDIYTFDNYISGLNKEAVEALQHIATGASHDNIYLWAGPGTGKSHLLRALCNLAARSERASACIPLSLLDDFSPDLFSSLETLNLVCLDDVDALAGRHDWELALFDLFNRLKDAKTPLVVSAGHSPKGSLIRLPDLKSRLSWGLCYHLQPLGERENIAALKQRAQERGFELSDQALEYLIKRVERDTRSLFCWLDRLDRHSLEAQRKLTVEFVKEILRDSEENPEIKSELP